MLPIRTLLPLVKKLILQNVPDIQIRVMKERERARGSGRERGAARSLWGFLEFNRFTHSPTRQSTE